MGIQITIAATVSRKGGQFISHYIGHLIQAVICLLIGLGKGAHGRTVFHCGIDRFHVPVMEAIFPGSTHVALNKNNVRDNNKSDILMASGPLCGNMAEHFKGLMIYCDPERSKVLCAYPRYNTILYLGPEWSLPFHKSDRIGIEIAVSMAAMFLLHMNGTTLTRILERNPSPMKRSYFIVYANTHCLPIRENFYDALVKFFGNNSGIHALGKCYGSYQKTWLGLDVGAGSNTRDAHMGTNVDFFSNFRYVIAMENMKDSNPHPGYMTEKLMNAYASGAVPIYYGDRRMMRFFNNDTYIFFDRDNINNTLLDIARLEADPSAYHKAVTSPVFRNEESMQDFLLMHNGKPTRLMKFVQKTIREQLQIIALKNDTDFMATNFTPFRVQRHHHHNYQRRYRKKAATID